MRPVPAIQALTAVSVLAAAAPVPSPAQHGGDAPPLSDGLGDHHMEITTAGPRAQCYFDQGLR